MPFQTKVLTKMYYDVNSSELATELSRENNMLSSHEERSSLLWVHTCDTLFYVKTAKNQ